MKHLTLISKLKYENLLSADEIEKVVSSFSYVEFRQNEVIVYPDQRFYKFYFLLEGFVRITYLCEDGQCRNQYFIEPNHFFSEPNAFYEQEPAKFCVQAINPCKVLVMTFEQRKVLMAQMPLLINLLLHYTNCESNRIIVAHAILSERTLECQLKMFILTYPLYSKQVTKKDFAQFIGMDYSSFVKKVNKMEKELVNANLYIFSS